MTTDKEIFIENSNAENLNPDKDTSGGVHMGYNIKKMRKAEGVKQLVLAEALGYNGKGGQQYISRLEEQAVIADDILEKIAPILKCTVNHLKYMKEDELAQSLYKFYGYSTNTQNNTQNITFNPLDALKEQFEKTQSVYENQIKFHEAYAEKMEKNYETYINGQNERLEEQRALIQSIQKSMDKSNEILLILAEKLKL